MLTKKIDEDLKIAMKTKDTIKLDTLRMLKAAVNNYLIEEKKDRADDIELIGLIQKQIKLRQDAIEGFQKGGRRDQAVKEAAEKAILEAYLPRPLTDEELRVLTTQAIQETGAESKNDIGKVMKEVLSKSQGRADGKRIHQIALGLFTAEDAQRQCAGTARRQRNWKFRGH